MSLTPSGCSFALSAGMKNVAGILYCSSRRNTRGSPARAPYSPCAISPGETCPSLSEGVSLSKSKDRPTATRELFGHSFGVRSRPARTCLTISNTLLSGHFQDGSCCWFCAAPIRITTSDDRPRRSDTPAINFGDLIIHSLTNLFSIEDRPHGIEAFAHVAQDHAVWTDGPSVHLITKRHGAQRRGCAARVTLPGAAAILGVKDNAVQPDGPHAFGVHGFDAQEVARQAADLNNPVLSAISRAQNQTFLAHSPAILRVCE